MRKTWLSSNIASTWRLSSRASSSVVPNGFSMITRTSASAWRGEAVRRPSSRDDHREEVGRGRQVEGAVERFAGLLVELVEHLLELGVDGLLVEFARDVLDVLEQAPAARPRRARAARSGGSPPRTPRGSPRPLCLCARRRRGGSARAARPRARGCRARAAVCAWRGRRSRRRCTSVVGATGRRSSPATSGFSGCGGVSMPRSSSAHLPLDFTACPPNWLRSAASTRSAKSPLPRERKRAYSEAVITGVGTSWAVASSIVQRPSPESAV